jgi:hypothetical protein
MAASKEVVTHHARDEQIEQERQDDYGEDGSDPYRGRLSSLGAAGSRVSFHQSSLPARSSAALAPPFNIEWSARFLASTIELYRSAVAESMERRERKQKKPHPLDFKGCGT